jgi:hypothetical protein
MQKKIALAYTLLLFTGAAPALAGGVQPRAYVALTGNDGPACGTASDPCGSLQYAHDHIVAAGGSIFIIDRSPPPLGGPALPRRAASGFAPIKITQGISIIADGVGASVVAPAYQAAIAIDIPASNSPGVVVLKGLTLDGLNEKLNVGVSAASAQGLVISNCTIKEFGGVGVDVATGGSTMLNFAISDTTLAANGIGLQLVLVQSASAIGTLTRVQAINNVLGVNIDGIGTSGAVRAMLIDVNASGNSAAGVRAIGALLYLARSSITGNGVGVDNQTVVYSYGDNYINGNISQDVSFPGSLTPVGRQ